MNASSSVAWSCAVALAFVGRASFAQDAPPTAPAPSTAPSTPPDAPPPFAEPSPAPAVPAPPDAPAPSEPPAAPTPPPPSTPPATPPGAPGNTGSAAFAPLPTAPKQATPRAAKPKAAVEPSSAPDVLPTAAPLAPDASATAGPSASAPASEPEESSSASGVFGPFRLGALIGGGLPDLVSLSGMIKVTRFFGAGINVGLIPTVKISYYGDATLSFQEYDAYGHIFPFGGAFFFGAGVGYATVKGTLATRFDLSAYHKQDAQIPASVEVSSQASVRTLVLTPQLGLLHTFGSGFTLGADVGAQIPIAPSQVGFSTQIPSDLGAYKAQIQKQYIDPNDAKVRSTLDKIGRTPVPTFGIKIGWLL